MDSLPQPLELTACLDSLRERMRGDAADEASQAVERHRAAVAELAGRQARFVYRVAYAAAGNAADAEDAVQETFLQLLRASPAGLAAIEDERGYLARIAWRLAHRRKKTHRPSSQQPGDDQSGDWLLDLPASGPSPEQFALHGDLEAWLHRSIDALPEKLRRPLALSALGELPGRQIAALLGLPEGTVRRRIHTARQILRQKMQERKGGRA